MALLKYEASVSAQVAQAFGIDYHNVRKIAEANPLPPIDPQPKEEIDTEDRQSNTFSDACKRVMKYSREEAMRMGNNYIGTEHILQGIIREALRYPLDAFVQLDLHLPAITRSIDDYVASSGESTVPNDLPFTPRAKTVLEMSAAEREDLAAPIVDIEHMLLALCKDEEGVAAQILAAYGVGYEKLRAIIAGDESPPAVLADR